MLYSDTRLSFGDQSYSSSRATLMLNGLGEEPCPQFSDSSGTQEPADGKRLFDSTSV